MVSRSEGKELAANGVANKADDDDWGAAWGDDDDQGQAPQETEGSGGVASAKKEKTPADDDDGADAWGWGDDAEAPADDKQEKPAADAQDDDDYGAAWGWGDEDDAAAPGSGMQTSPNAKKKKASAVTTTSASTPAPEAAEDSREMVLKETYHISSMPEPVLQLIEAILEDGATLTRVG